MSELTKSLAIICRHLSDALLNAARELSNSDDKIDPIIVSSEPKSVSIEVGVHVIFLDKKGKKLAGVVNKIDGDRLEVENAVIGKSWTTSKSAVVHVSLGDWYY